jgi:hypothetical protein
MFLMLTRIPTHPAAASVTITVILARPDPVDIWIASRNGGAKANLQPRAHHCCQCDDSCVIKRSNNARANRPRCDLQRALLIHNLLLRTLDAAKARPQVRK